MKIRHKLLLFGLAAAALTALAVFLAAGILIRRIVSDRVTERLHREALVLSDFLALDPALLPEGFGDLVGAGPTEAFAHTAGTALGLRVTIIALDGKVLGDSSLGEEDLRRLENHASRPEIVLARAAGVGASERRSTTVHDQLLYVARRVDREGRPVGFVRLAEPVAEIERTTGSYSFKLGLFSFIALLVIAGIGYVAAARFSRPMEEMSRAADAIASGRHDVEVEYGSSDEIGHLGAALNRMARSLSEQIRALSSEKLLRDTILAGMSEGILVVDRERRILLCNDALRTVLGLRGRDIAGQSLIEVVREHVVIEGFDAALIRGERFREIARFWTNRGMTCEVAVSPLKGPNGERIGAVGLFFDVTRLTALERIRRDFVADASHELRTPLTSIRAFVETLLAGGLEDSSNNRRFLEIIKKHSDRMEAILDDLTDLSLIETGAIALEKERIELHPIARDLLESLRPKAEGRGVSLAVQVPLGIALTADRRRLEQVLLNLLDNAIKFNRNEGSVILRASALNDSSAGFEESGRAAGAGGVRIEVEDTGIGIPADALEKIFHRFYRVDCTRSREMGGTGLGLSIVKHLMQAHGGSVRVESRPGRGSCFILEFPGLEASLTPTA